jgi:hypothetical protein
MTLSKKRPKDEEEKAELTKLLSKGKEPLPRACFLKGHYRYRVQKEREIGEKMGYFSLIILFVHTKLLYRYFKVKIVSN